MRMELRLGAMAAGAAQGKPLGRALPTVAVQSRLAAAEAAAAHAEERRWRRQIRFARIEQRQRKQSDGQELMARAAMARAGQAS